jgi:hypothetical protein
MPKRQRKQFFQFVIDMVLNTMVPVLSDKHPAKFCWIPEPVGCLYSILLDIDTGILIWHIPILYVQYVCKPPIASYREDDGSKHEPKILKPILDIMKTKEICFQVLQLMGLPSYSEKSMPPVSYIVRYRTYVLLKTRALSAAIRYKIREYSSSVLYMLKHGLRMF